MEMKEEAIFVQLMALCEAAALAFENGKKDAGMGTLYTAIDVLRETLEYYPAGK